MNQEKALGAAIAKARREAGFTQQSLCSAVNLSYSTLAKIERGAIKTPSVFTVVAIAAATNTTVEELTKNSDQSLFSKRYRTSKSGIKFVYYDINGVLVRFYQRAFTNIAEDLQIAPDVIEEIYWRCNDAVCRGDMSLEQFNQQLAEKLGQPSFAWEKYYLDSIEPISEMYDSIVEVSANYKVGLVSNIMPGLIKSMIKRGILPDIDYKAIIDSSEVGAIKPELEIYKLATEISKVSPSEILFIDDDRANIMAADKFGWKVLWFDDYRPEATKKRIEEVLA